MLPADTNGARGLAPCHAPKSGRRQLSAPTLLAATWTLLALGPWLAGALGRESATLLIFSVCAGLTLCRQPNPLRGDGERQSAWVLDRCGVLLWGIAAGWGLAPGLGWGVLHLGTLLGLEPVEPLGSDWSIRAGTLLLAPVFEEILYRERLLGWLRARTGPVPAILLSSLAFALPHPGPWSRLTSFVVGLGLANVRRASGSLLLCIALHAGFNLASEIALAGATHWLLRPEFSLWLGLPATAAAVVRMRSSNRSAA